MNAATVSQPQAIHVGWMSDAPIQCELWPHPITIHKALVPPFCMHVVLPLSRRLSSLPPHPLCPLFIF